jgi:hypothetical protein
LPTEGRCLGMGKVTELFIRRLCRKVKKAFKRACAEREISMQDAVETLMWLYSRDEKIQAAVKYHRKQVEEEKGDEK